MTREEIIKEICKAVGMPDKDIYDIAIRYNGELRIGYLRDKFEGVQYRWMKWPT